MILAALVPTPVAVIAAAAAYAAGRAQARGAHRGPIDAVRRQHQRDAYAAFLNAANVYAEATSWRRCTDQAIQDLLAVGQPPLEELTENGACALAGAASRQQLTATAAVVDLEGPEHITVLSGELTRAARDVEKAARTHGLLRPSNAYDDPQRPTLRGSHQILQEAIHAFTSVARQHLNSGRIT